MSHHSCLTQDNIILFFPAQTNTRGWDLCSMKWYSLAALSKLQNLDSPDCQKQPIPYNQTACTGREKGAPLKETKFDSSGQSCNHHSSLESSEAHRAPSMPSKPTVLSHLPDCNTPCLKKD